jgi:hypothetical protein
MSYVKPEEVRGVWSALTGVYGSELVDKASAPEMRAVAAFLAKVGIQESEESFLERYATTLGLRIYLPFELGVAGAGGHWSLWSQINTIAHEHQHIIQYRKLGPVRFAARYLISTASRARLEAEAYRVNMELDYWRYGRVADPHKLAAHLHGYGCPEEDIRLAASLLVSAASEVKEGTLICEATREALKWLNAYAPHLRWDGHK